MDIKTAISIISLIIAGASFYFARKNDTKKDTQSSAYNQGAQDANYKNIMAKLEKIEEKLELYDNAFKTTAQEVTEELKAYVNNYVNNILEKHVLKYHDKE